MAGLTAGHVGRLDTTAAKVARITFDDNYPTGGEAVTAALFGLNSLSMVIPIGTRSGYMIEYSASAAKLLVYTPTKSAAAHTHDETGTTTAAGGAVSAAAAPEVANGTDLSALSVWVLALGS